MRAFKRIDPLFLYAPVIVAIAILLLVAIWAGYSRQRWQWRIVVVCAALLSLYPIRAFEPIVWFSIAMPLAAIFAWLVRYIHDATGETASLNNERRFQLRLVDLLFLVGLSGVASAVAAGLLREQVPLDWRFGGIILCCTAIALLCFGVVFGRRWRWLLLVGLILNVAGSLVIYVIALYQSHLEMLEPWGPIRDTEVKRLWAGGTFCGLYLGVLFLGLLSARAMIPFRSAERGKRWRLVDICRVVLGALCVAILVPNVVIYWRMLRKPPFPESSFTTTNSFPEVERVLSEFAELNPNLHADLRFVPPAAAKEYPQLEEELKTTLATPGHIPFDPDNDANIDFYDQMSPLTQSASCFSSIMDEQARLAIASGRHDDACRISLACIQLGNTFQRGGLDHHHSTGFHIEQVGARRLSECRGQASADCAGSLLSSLLAIEQSREPMTLIDARVLAFEDRAYNWIKRLEIAIAWMIGDDSRIYAVRFTDRPRDRDTMIRLLILDLAIRSYRAFRGQLPDDLNQLPEFITDEMRIDPMSGNPFVYEPQGDSWLLYSAGPDGMDNGGVFRPFSRIIDFAGDGYDYSLDGANQ